MTVKELMTTPVKTCRANALVGEAARMMLEENCGCLPVVDAHDRLAGILTDRDVCLAVARHQNPLKASVREAMTSHVASELWTKHAERVPLFQDAGAFVGQRDHGRLLQGILADP